MAEKNEVERFVKTRTLAKDFKKTMVVESLRSFFKIAQDQKDLMNEHLQWVDNLVNEIEIDKEFIQSVEQVRKMQEANKAE